METKKRTQATDIAEIATKLDGKVEFSSIIYSQKNVVGEIPGNGGKRYVFYRQKIWVVVLYKPGGIR